MISFKQFISEAPLIPRDTAVLDQSSFQTLLDKCSSAVANAADGNFIWRGDTEWAADFLRANTLNSLRKSDNTYNHYTELIDTHPAFKNFPKRSRGLICTPSKTKAKPYGDLYKIYPYDDAKIGICPHKDIWDTKIKLWGNQISLPSLNTFLDHIGIDDADVIEQLKKYSERTKINSTEYSILKSVLPSYFSHANIEDIRNSFFEDIMEAFTPERLGFRWVYAKDLDFFAVANSEIWVEGEMLAERTQRLSVIRKIKELVK